MNGHDSATPEDCLSASQPLASTVKCGVVNPCSCCNKPVPPKPGCSILCARYVLFSSVSTVPSFTPQVQETDLQHLFPDVYSSSALPTPYSNVELYPYSPMHAVVTAASTPSCDVPISH